MVVDTEVDTDHQLKKVEEFVNDLTKITNEITREGYAFYEPPSTNQLYIIVVFYKCINQNI